jgi:hypothetical protein
MRGPRATVRRPRPPVVAAAASAQTSRRWVAGEDATVASEGQRGTRARQWGLRIARAVSVELGSARRAAAGRTFDLASDEPAHLDQPQRVEFPLKVADEPARRPELWRVSQGDSARDSLRAGDDARGEHLDLLRACLRQLYVAQQRDRQVVPKPDQTEHSSVSRSTLGAGRREAAGPTSCCRRPRAGR